MERAIICLIREPGRRRAPDPKALAPFFLPDVSSAVETGRFQRAHGLVVSTLCGRLLLLSSGRQAFLTLGRALDQPRNLMAAAALVITSEAVAIGVKPFPDEFGLPRIELGYPLSSFLWTYVTIMIPMAWAAGRFGACKCRGLSRKQSRKDGKYRGGNQ